MWCEGDLRSRRGIKKETKVMGILQPLPPLSQPSLSGEASSIALEPGSNLISELHLHFLSAESESRNLGALKEKMRGKEGGQGLVRVPRPQQ